MDERNPPIKLYIPMQASSIFPLNIISFTIRIPNTRITVTIVDLKIFLTAFINHQFEINECFLYHLEKRGYGLLIGVCSALIFSRSD